MSPFRSLSTGCPFQSTVSFRNASTFPILAAERISDSGGSADVIISDRFTTATGGRQLLLEHVDTISKMTFNSNDETITNLGQR